jgi:hypothetical protein
MSISLVLLIASFILFVIAATPYSPPKFNLIAAGLACWVLSILLSGGYIHR